MLYLNEWPRPGTNLCHLTSEFFISSFVKNSALHSQESFRYRSISNSEYLVRNPVTALQRIQRYSKIKYWRSNFFWIFLAWHEPETQGVQELILDFFKVHSWLTYGCKSVRFWWYFHTFHENADEVLLKIRLQTTTKTIFGAVFFMYLLTNTNIART